MKTIIFTIFFMCIYFGYCYADMHYEMDFADKSFDYIDRKIDSAAFIKSEYENKTWSEKIIKQIYMPDLENPWPLNSFCDAEAIAKISNIRKEIAARLKHDIDNNQADIATSVYQQILKNIVKIDITPATPEEQALIDYRLYLFYTRSFETVVSFHNKDERLNKLTLPFVLNNSGFKYKFKPVKKSILYSKDTFHEDNNLNIYGFLILNCNNNFNAYKLYLYIWEDIPSDKIKSETTSNILPFYCNSSLEFCPDFQLPSIKLLKSTVKDIYLDKMYVDFCKYSTFIYNFQTYLRCLSRNYLNNKKEFARDFR